MIDTVRLMLDVADSGGADLLGTATYLTTSDLLLNQSTGEEWLRGTLGAFRINANSGYLYAEGALPTILFSSNAHILTRREVAQSIEKMSDLLHLPIEKARVTRLDCSYHWLMSKPVSEYIERLGELSRFKRVLKTANSLCYNKGGKELCNSLIFYNKTDECASKCKPVPDAYKDTLLLRYECRWLKNPSKQFGLNVLTAGQLSERDFYRQMVTRWAEFYFAINKSRQGSFNFDGVSDVRSFKDWLLGYFLSREDAQTLDSILQAARERKLFVDAKYYTRLRCSLRESMKRASKEIENDLIRELDCNVRNVLAYCR